MAVTLPIESVRTSAVSASIPQRIAGYAGLAFAILVALVNVMLGAAAPPAFDAPAAEITTWIADHRTLLLVATSVVPFGVILLYAFISGAYTRLSQGSAEAAFWARLGGIGIVLVEVLFLARFVFEVVLIANAERLTSEPAVVEILWQFQSAALILNGLALGVALAGLSRAARLSGLMPAWQQAMGLAAALGFLIASVAVVPSLEGSTVGLLAFPAFVTWLVWLAITSIRLLKDADAMA